MEAWRFFLADMNAFLSATLLVAVNELRRSAAAKGMSFYKYGMCFRNQVYYFISFICLKLPSTIALFLINMYKILVYLSVFPMCGSYMYQFIFFNLIFFFIVKVLHVCPLSPHCPPPNCISSFKKKNVMWFEHEYFIFAFNLSKLQYLCICLYNLKSHLNM